MSRLGIAFVLPYVGANGIKVVNNEIGLDQNGVGELGALILNKTGVAGAMGTILSIWNDVIDENDNIDILNIYGQSVQYLDSSGKLVVNEVDTNDILVENMKVNNELVIGANGSPYTQIEAGTIRNFDENETNTVTIDVYGLVDCEQIKTNYNNADSPELVFLHLDNANNLAITVNGENGNSLQVVPTV